MYTKNMSLLVRRIVERKRGAEMMSAGVEDPEMTKGERRRLKKQRKKVLLAL
jgi:hypothetical protein